MIDSIYDVIVVGAGVVGCAMAASQGRAGRKVLCIERDMKQPDRIVGELMQPAGMQALKDLGLEHATDGIEGIPCKGYRFYYGRDKYLHIPYTAALGENLAEDEKESVTVEGEGFVHGRFIMGLRKELKRLPNVTMREAVVTDLIRHNKSGQVLGVTCKDKNSHTPEQVHAPLTIVCDGCFSNLRKQFITRKIEVNSHFVGMVLRNISLPAPNYGHLFLNKGCLVLLYQISPSETRILMAYPHPKLPSKSSGELTKFLKDTVYPILPNTIQPAFMTAITDTDHIKSMPNQYLPPSLNKTPGLFIIGDALNMRHPLTGGGMTVGLTDAVIADKVLSPQEVPDLKDTTNVLRQLEKFSKIKKDNGSSINILSIALYNLFADSSYSASIIQDGFFSYLNNGGVFVRGPIGFIAGLRRSPMFLSLHFFSMALYSVFRYWFSLKWLRPSSLPWFFLAPVAVSLKACSILLPYVAKELVFN